MLHQRDGYRFLIEYASKWAGSLWWVQTALRKCQEERMKKKIPADQKNTSACMLPAPEGTVVNDLRTTTHRNPVLVLLHRLHHGSKHHVTLRKHHCRNQGESLVNNPVSKTPARASFSHSLPKWVGGLSSDIKSPQQFKTKARCGFAELRQNRKINWAESRQLLRRCSESEGLSPGRTEG